VCDGLPLIKAWQLALDVEATQLHRTKVVAGPALPTFERILAARPTRRRPCEPARRSSTTRSIWRTSAARGARGPLGELYRAGSAIDLEDLIDNLIDLYRGSTFLGSIVALVGAAGAGRSPGCLRSRGRHGDRAA
jgi:hypothetical protein